MQFLQEVKKWLGEITEIALLLIALGITFEILFGFEGIPFFGGVVANITKLLNELGQNGLAGLIALGVILYLFHRRRYSVPNQ
ncbi:MAG: hypothetical protein P8016_07205 [Sedimentisphaerales bacterium]